MSVGNDSSSRSDDEKRELADPVFMQQATYVGKHMKDIVTKVAKDIQFQNRSNKVVDPDELAVLLKAASVSS